MWCFVKWNLFELPSHSETWRNILKWTLHASACICVCNASRKPPPRQWGSQDAVSTGGHQAAPRERSSQSHIGKASWVRSYNRLWTCHGYRGNDPSGPKTAESAGHSRADRGCGAAAARAPQEGSWISTNAAAGWGHCTLPTRFLFLTRPYSYPNLDKWLVFPTQKGYLFILI